jgi:hypothetical protein
MRRFILAVGLIAFVGCETSVPPTPEKVAKAKPTATRPEPQPPAFAPKVDPNAKPVVVEEPKPEAVEMVRVVAKAGVTDRGKYDPGIVTTPLTANFSLQEQIVFDGEVPAGLRNFEAARNRRPKDHQEFMSEVIRKYNIKLPPLPPQHRYIYDAESGKLMVERPKNAD